jgi:hypothetical protein
MKAFDILGDALLQETKRASVVGCAGRLEYWQLKVARFLHRDELASIVGKGND